MTVAHRRRPIAPTLLSAGTPYVERADHRENGLDTVLLTAWGRVSPHLLSGLERTQLERLVQRAQGQEKRLIGLRDEQLRQTADELRGRLLSTSFDADEIALSFALAREAARRRTGMRRIKISRIRFAQLGRSSYFSRCPTANL